MAYLSVGNAVDCELVIEKSRFIAYARHVTGEEEARLFLAELHKEHPLATHICYAFVADAAGNVVRFSDDGEPQGTAGMPILGAIKAKKFFETAVAVVRYFGGIKLGAGGLTRAYSSSAQNALSRAQTVEYDDCALLSVKATYQHVNALMRIIGERKLSCERNFGEEAEFILTVRAGRKRELLETLNDATNGKIAVKELSQTVAPFPLEP